MEKLKKRDLYLKKLISFQDRDIIKVVTGIRRCGKSSLLKLMVEHLKESGIQGEQILEMNFESYEYKNMSSDDVYNYVKTRSALTKKAYLFLDEIQRINGWEDAINAMRVDLNCDIYVTGSNTYLLSSEYATYLAGRCIEIKMLPLSFSEFLYFHGFEIKKTKGIFGDNRKRIVTGNDESYELRELFNLYLSFGGMPSIVDFDQEMVLTLLDGIYSTVVVRDILEREKRKNERQITDPILLRKIVLFLADNIGSSISASSIGNTLFDEGLLNGEGKRNRPSTNTVQSYISALLDSYFFYEIKRFDIKGKEFLRTLGKYYIVDVGLRNFLLGFRNRDNGHILENIVYFELLRRGYDVSIGKVDNMEIDFIATNANERKYIQVTESMQSEDVRKRELLPLQKVTDNYEKIVLSLNTGLDSSYDGIKSENLVEWLITQ